MTKRPFRTALIGFTALAAVTGCSMTGKMPDTATVPAVSMTSAAWTPTTTEARNANPHRSPIMLRVFKEEGVLEIWMRGANGRFALADTFEICTWSGKLGPKFLEGDRQAPEGFYTVRPGQMNPNSQYHLSFNIGFPNAFDRVNGRTGSHLMVHGACSSAGCYSMNDDQIELIYAYAQQAFRGGQQAFQVQAFPFRMTAENMARYRNDPNYDFWMNLKEGYDHFELTKSPPKVDVCERRYVFNRVPLGGASFSPAATCPASTAPDVLTSAYSAWQDSWTKSFERAARGRMSAPAPSISGPKEAAFVAEWQTRRIRGEQVPPEPPSIEAATPAQIERARRAVAALEDRRRRAGIRTPAPRAPAALADAGEATALPEAAERPSRRF